MVATNSITKSSAYLEYLPGVFQQDAERGDFLGRYLKIFEKILAGIDDEPQNPVTIEGVEQIVARLHEFFDAETAPTEFLDWLAGWMALKLPSSWLEAQKRRTIRRIIPLYKLRGTKAGLTEYLKIFVGDGVTIEEQMGGIVIGTTSTVGMNTFLGGFMPHFFVVTITFATITSLGFARDFIQATRAIIDLEKPAHTYYALRLQFPGIIVGSSSTVGVNTIIGSGFPQFV